MTPDVEQELAHILLVELLAHQFTFPVRWIETQDVLLLEQGVERLVEIGPSSTLTNMARRTIESKYNGHDPRISTQREFLSATTHRDAVYYRINAEEAFAGDYDPNIIDVAESSKPQPLVEVPSNTPVTTVLPISTAISIIPDAKLEVSHVIRILVASKLKKPTSQIDMDLAIKTLAGGRSTLENEIVGDLLSEFKSLPERPEEHPLQALCEHVALTFDGTLGSYSLSQIRRLFSSKMPGGFSVDRAREYLRTKWGLLERRQDMVLLSAQIMAPKSRLKTFEGAEAFFDERVREHVVETGVILSKISSTNVESQLLDPLVITSLEKTRKDLSQKKLQLYAQDLGLDLRAGDKVAEATQKALDDAIVELDILNREHGSAYTSGIRPLIRSSKARTYKSWWNWAMEEVTDLFYKVIRGEPVSSTRELESQILHITNGSSSRLIAYIKYLQSQASKSMVVECVTATEMMKLLAIACERSLDRQPVFKTTGKFLMPRIIIDVEGTISVHEVPRIKEFDFQSIIAELGKDIRLRSFHDQVHSEHPNLVIKSQGMLGWKQDERLTSAYLAALNQANSSGLSFSGKNVLLTGAGPCSIGVEILKQLLAGGASVLVTTSRYSAETARFFQETYSRHGGRGSQLTLLPFNQASTQDIEALVSYIYDEKALNWDLDLVLPLAAIPESDRAIDQIDGTSELAHRAMLTNTVRLLGAIMQQKQIRCIDTRPAHVILPLSANHGIIGRDGLYAESKLALEGLLYKWHSEDWGCYLSICGAEIGWTRGTGLMSANDSVAEGVESLGVRTFSRSEMALNLVALATPAVVQACQEEPLLADLNGGLDKVKNLGKELKRIREEIQEVSAIRRAVFDEVKHEHELVSEHTIDAPEGDEIARRTIKARSSIQLPFPPVMDYETEIEPLSKRIKGMVDLEHVVVITGFAELGPLGNARIRLEMELQQGLSDTGCIELAWIMGLIKQDCNKQNQSNSWVDAHTGEVIEEWDIKRRYEERILQHTGIRLVKTPQEQERQSLQELVLQSDLPPFLASQEAATEFVRLHGEKAETWKDPSSEQWFVLLKAGATLLVPKATSSSTTDTVAGQLPSGWDASRYGIDASIIAQVDPITLYALVATVEALLSAGIPDFYDIYTHIHPSTVANCIGSGQGGLSAARVLYRDRLTEQNASTIQNDILQETFLNTTGAWINMLLLGASGPLRTPVGACATALESLDAGAELIASGRAKIALVGGVDDWSADSNAEFGAMRATVDVATQTAAGREPREFSRPMSSTRAGFVEAHGAGVQVLASAALALELGLPVRGIVAFTGLAADKVGRSVPAPGKGILGFAGAEESDGPPCRMLDLDYRRRLLERRLRHIEDDRDLELELLAAEAATIPHSHDSPAAVSPTLAARRSEIHREAHSASLAARRSLGNAFHLSSPYISPLAGALAVWGLDVNSIGIVALHGTSTIQGDLNEARVLHAQLTALGRGAGNPALALCSKWVTGHGKGAAGAWALNGALQALETGVVPGNRNLDDVAPELAGCEMLLFPSRAVRLGRVEAVSVTGFGFGQKGAQVLVVHPRYLFAALEGGRGEYERYVERARCRGMVAKREFEKGVFRGDLVGRRIREGDAWAGVGEKEEDVLLDKGWRSKV